MKTTPPEEAPAAAPTKPRKGVLCAKCDHLNAADRKKCEYCGSSLYIACNHCGKSTPRVSGRCPECGHRLHRSFWRKWEKKILGSRPKITVFQVVLLVVSVYAVYQVIVRVVEYQPPAP